MRFHLRAISGAALEIERPIVEPRLPRRAPKLHAIDSNAGILQVGEAVFPVSQHPSRRLRRIFECQVVVPGDHDFGADEARRESSG